MTLKTVGIDLGDSGTVDLGGLTDYQVEVRSHTSGCGARKSSSRVKAQRSRVRLFHDITSFLGVGQDCGLSQELFSCSKLPVLRLGPLAALLPVQGFVYYFFFFFVIVFFFFFFFCVSFFFFCLPPLLFVLKLLA